MDKSQGVNEARKIRINSEIVSRRQLDESFDEEFGVEGGDGGGCWGGEEFVVGDCDFILNAFNSDDASANGRSCGDIGNSSGADCLAMNGAPNCVVNRDDESLPKQRKLLIDQRNDGKVSSRGSYSAANYRLKSMLLKCMSEKGKLERVGREERERNESLVEKVSRLEIESLKAFEAHENDVRSLKERHASEAATRAAHANEVERSLAKIKVWKAMVQNELGEDVGGIFGTEWDDEYA